MAQTKALTVRQQAQQVAKCGGYSADRYRSWPAVAEALLREGFTPREAEAIMRSKHTRWAADADDAHRYGYHPGRIIVDYLWRGRTDSAGVEYLAGEVLELVEGTFTDERRHVTKDDFISLVSRLTHAQAKRRKEAK
jgi:hypothetical protein